jgi:hypothetical protein
MMTRKSNPENNLFRYAAGIPPGSRDGRVAVLPTVEHHRSASSVNRKLAALTSFCEFHARHGVDLAGLLVRMRPAGRGSALS